MLPTTVPHSGDTEVTPLIDGHEYFGSLATAIDGTSGAGDVIYMVNWVFDPSMQLRGTAPPELGTLLAEKAAAGVDVRIIVWTGRFLLGKKATGLSDPAWWSDAVPYALDAYKKIVDFNVKNVLALRKLKPASLTTAPLEGRVLMDWAGGTFGSRHQKYAVVYSKTAQDLRAYVGSLDFSKVSASSSQHNPGEVWHNAGVQLRGGAAAAVWVDFRTRWAEVRSLPGKQFMLGGVTEYFNPTTAASLAVPAIPGPGSVPIVSVTSTASVRIVRSYAEYKESLVGNNISWTNTPPAGGLQEVYEFLKKALNAATSYVYIEDQALNSHNGIFPHNLLWPYVRDATNRGVKVIFVVPGNPIDSSDPTNLDNDSWSITLFPNLAPNRTNFVMYRVDDVMVHSKVVIIDDEFVSIGSANFFDRSMDGTDTELNAAIVDTGPLVGDIRVKLWAEHLRVDVTNPTIKSELADLGKSLAIFKSAWGSGVTFASPNSRLTVVPE